MTPDQIREIALRVAGEVKGFHWDGSLYAFVEPFIAAVQKASEPVAELGPAGLLWYSAQTAINMPCGTKFYTFPPAPAIPDYTLENGTPFKP